MKLSKNEILDLIKTGTAESIGALTSALEELKSSVGDPEPTPVPEETSASVDSDRSKTVGGIVRALAKNAGVPSLAAVWAQKAYGPEHDVTKALQLSDEAAGGFLIPPEYSGEVIELLRAESVVMQLGPRTLPIQEGELRVPRLSSGATFSWMAEGDNVTKSEQTFGQEILRRRKGAALVPISNDLLRVRSGGSVDSFVTMDMVGAAGAGVDLAYIRGSGVSNEPKGLLNRGVSNNANTTVNLANVTSDLVSPLVRMWDANVKGRNIGILMPPSVWGGLYSARDGNGNYVWKDEMDRGTLLSYPFRKTSQIPGGVNFELYVVDFDNVVVGEADGLLVEAFPGAAYHDGASVQSGVSRDETVIRAIIYTDIIDRHADAIQIVKGNGAADWTNIPAS